MKYESSILKRLVDTYGVVGNPQYISEVIKEFIVKGKEKFPNLFTYQSDWLAHIDEFGLDSSYIVSYTGQSFYAPNTLEKPIKSAILKGCTKYRDIDTGEVLDAFEEGRNLELVSVKMPVLTTTGKNLFSLQEDELVGYQYDTTTNSFTCFPDGRKWSDVPYVKLTGNQNYIISYDVIKASSNSRIEFNITNGSIPMKSLTNIGVQSTTVNIGQDVEFRIKFLDGDAVVRNIQVEVGSTATTYEPYKTNILTVNEDVTLRSNGNICDELNLLTGQLTQRIDEDGEVLSQEVVKTVDLTILDQNGQNVKQLMSFNGGTHFNTRSSEGSPLPTVSVTVETDLKETLKMCTLDGNTL